MYPQRKPMRLNGYDYANTERACFITISSKIRQLAPDSPLDRTQPFAYAPFAEQIIGALHHYEQHNDLTLYAYSLMPNHLHVLAQAGPQTGDIVKLFFRFKSYTARCAWAHGVVGQLWLRDCYDVVERKTRQHAERVVAYILNNPVKAGLVAANQEHPYTKLITPL